MTDLVELVEELRRVVQALGVEATDVSDRLKAAENHAALRALPSVKPVDPAAIRAEAWRKASELVRSYGEGSARPQCKRDCEALANAILTLIEKDKT